MSHIALCNLILNKDSPLRSPSVITVVSVLLQSSTSKSLETDSHEECDTVQAYTDPNPVIQKYGGVMKRHSAGEVADRNNRAKSLHLPNDR